MRPEDRAREMLAEAGIPEAGSTRLMESLTSLGRTIDEVEPLPGPELASLMAQTSRPARRRRARLMVATAVALGTVGAGGVAVAANELPDGAQDLVARFSERYLPFDLPRAETPGDHDAGTVPAPQAPAAVREAERVDDLPALSPADEKAAVGGAFGGAPDEVAGPDASERSPGSPSPADPAQTPSVPAPSPSEEAGPAGNVADVDESGGALGPEAGQAPVTEPQTEASTAAQEPKPEASPAPDAGARPDAPTGQQTGKPQNREERGSAARGKPGVGPPEQDDP
jgi:hypothetical protein